ncbi:MAG: hypothetical protein NVS3B16_03630 [Vulcanimicrobiaceae bacterium]
MALLEVRNLRVGFKTDDGFVSAVNGLSYTVESGSTLGIVGESGSGKSVNALSIMRLIPMPPGRIDAGTITLRGANLLQKSESEMRKIRGKDIAMIFQDPMTSLNPVLTVGDQISEAVALHLKLNKRDALTKTVDMLRLVRIPLPEKRVREYPHQLSGGMRQRVMIAMALSCDPDVLIADEPTTALDVTIQAQIIDLMNEMQQRLGSAIVMITHDLGVVAETCQNVLVMYAGNMIEYGNATQIFSEPKHPYTMGLLASVPRLDDREHGRLVPIEGQPPNLLRIPPGCSFAPRCKYRMPICAEPVPLYDFGGGHVARCFLYDERTEGERRGAGARGRGGRRRGWTRRRRHADAAPGAASAATRDERKKSDTDTDDSQAHPDLDPQGETTHLSAGTAVTSRRMRRGCTPCRPVASRPSPTPRRAGATQTFRRASARRARSGTVPAIRSPSSTLRSTRSSDRSARAPDSGRRAGPRGRSSSRATRRSASPFPHSPSRSARVATSSSKIATTGSSPRLPKASLPNLRNSARGSRRRCGTARATPSPATHASPTPMWSSRTAGRPHSPQYARASVTMRASSPTATARARAT